MAFHSRGVQDAFVATLHDEKLIERMAALEKRVEWLEKWQGIGDNLPADKPDRMAAARAAKAAKKLQAAE